MRFLACIMLLTACHTRAPVNGPVPAGREVIVRYASATEVPLIRGSDTTRLSVRELRGEVSFDRGDTIRLRVSRGRTADSQPVPAGSIALVTLAPGVQAETRRLDLWKTAFYTYWTAAGLMVAYYLLMIIGLKNSSSY
jgi:hypothetical protein